MKKFFKNYSLSILLVSLFVVSWVLQGVFEWKEFANDSMLHGAVPHFSGFVNEFFSATFENWQSEFLQLFTFVVLATYFIHKGSPQSRDGDDHMRAQLDRIEKKLNQPE